MTNKKVIRIETRINIHFFHLRVSSPPLEEEGGKVICPVIQFKILHNVTAETKRIEFCEITKEAFCQVKKMKILRL